MVLAGGDIYGIFILISISLIADFLDGMVARAMKISSPIGKELDSLADVISFGVTPGLMMLVLLLNYPISGNALYTGQIHLTWLSLIGLMIPAFSALRLAKFNLDEEQSTYFKGLATPSNTLLIFSVFYIVEMKGQMFSATYDWIMLIAITVISSFLLIADLPLFALKFKGLAWRDNYYKYIFLMISLVLLIFFKFYAIPFIILLYIITSIIYKKEIIK